MQNINGISKKFGFSFFILKFNVIFILICL